MVAATGLKRGVQSRGLRGGGGSGESARRGAGESYAGLQRAARGATMWVVQRGTAVMADRGLWAARRENKWGSQGAAIRMGQVKGYAARVVDEKPGGGGGGQRAAMHVGQPTTGLRECGQGVSDAGGAVGCCSPGSRGAASCREETRRGGDEEGRRRRG